MNKKLPKTRNRNGANKTQKRYMKFRVGATTYALSITPGPLLFQNEACAAGCLSMSGEILIAGDEPKGKRLDLLARELARAWTFECGEPKDIDGWLGMASTVARVLYRDLRAQGGETALTDMLPKFAIGMHDASPAAACRREERAA